MNLLILVVDDEPDVELLFRQQFRRRKALANGADAFLTKPIDFAIVRDEIDMCVGHAA